MIAQLQAAGADGDVAATVLHCCSYATAIQDSGADKRSQWLEIARACGGSTPSLSRSGPGGSVARSRYALLSRPPRPRPARQRDPFGGDAGSTPRDESI